MVPVTQQQPEDYASHESPPVSEVVGLRKCIGDDRRVDRKGDNHAPHLGATQAEPAHGEDEEAPDQPEDGT